MKQDGINIILIGMPGSGKTCIGRILAKRLNMDFCDVDEYIEIKEGKKIKEIFMNGENHFRKLERAAVEELSKSVNTVISTGGGVVLDSRNIQLLKQSGIIFFINRPIQNIVRDMDTSNRPLLANDNEKIYGIYEERYELYKKYSAFEVYNDRGLPEAVEQIIEMLEGGKICENTGD